MKEVDPKTLRPNPWNSNSVNPKNMGKLKKSITDLGFYRPVVVRTLASGELEILGGQHRTEAAIELGLKSIPIINLGRIDDNKAKKIGLADNARYGADDAIRLAKIIEEVTAETPDITGFLPMQDEDLQLIMRAVEVDLDTLEVGPEDRKDEERDPTDRAERPVKTHEVLKFRVANRDAEAIAAIIEKTIKREGITGGDEMTSAGEALAILLLGKS